MDDAEGAGTFDMLSGAVWSYAYALAQVAYLVTVQGVPRGSHFGVATDIAVFHVIFCVRVEER